MAGMYAVYHGPKGLRAIATQIHTQAVALAKGLEKLGFKLKYNQFFDTLCVFCDSAATIAAAEKERVNFLQIDDNHVGISLNETTTPATLEHLLSIFASQVQQVPAIAIEATASALPSDQARKTSYLNHQTFQQYHSETALMRYIKSLSARI